MLDIEQSALRRAEPKYEDVKAKRQIKAKCAARNKMQNGQSNKFSIFTWNVEEGYLYRCNYGQHTAGTIHILHKQRIEHTKTQK